MLYCIRGAPAAKFLLKNLGNHKNTTLKDISEAVTFVVLCHDAKFLCQIYVVCVLGSKTSCLQYLVKGSKTKKWDRYIFKCFTVNRTFIWDVWLTTFGETACHFGIRFSWHTCFPNTIFLSLGSLFKIKYVFLVVFLSIYSANGFKELFYESDRHIWQLYCKDGWKGIFYSVCSSFNSIWSKPKQDLQ